MIPTLKQLMCLQLLYTLLQAVIDGLCITSLNYYVAGLNLIFKVPRTNVPTYSQMYRYTVKLYRHEHFTLLELE